MRSGGSTKKQKQKPKRPSGNGEAEAEEPAWLFEAEKALRYSSAGDVLSSPSLTPSTRQAASAAAAAAAAAAPAAGGEGDGSTASSQSSSSSSSLSSEPETTTAQPTFSPTKHGSSNNAAALHRSSGNNARGISSSSSSSGGGGRANNAMTMMATAASSPTTPERRNKPQAPPSPRPTPGVPPSRRTGSGGGGGGGGGADLSSPSLVAQELASPSSTVANLELRVSASETVLVSPHNRDVLLRPKRGDPPPDGSQPTCTAFVVDVTRGALRYSMPVRFSRFERLHAELSAELGRDVAMRLPPLPPKRGPLDPSKLAKLIMNLRLPGMGGGDKEQQAGGGGGGAPPPPSSSSSSFSSPLGSSLPPPGPATTSDELHAIEQRTLALDAYVRALCQMPQVLASSALQELCALSEPAENALRQALEAATSHDEARISHLNRELAAASSYVRAAAARTERAEGRSSALTLALENAVVTLGGACRDASRVALCWRRWATYCSRAARARHAKAAAAAAARLRAEAERSEALEEEVKRLREVISRQEVALEGERDEKVKLWEEVHTLQRHVLDGEEAARQSEAEAAERVELAEMRADAAANIAAAARAEARSTAAQYAAEKAATASLSSALAHADEALGVANACVVARVEGRAALVEELEVQRRRRIVLALTSALEQRAAEGRLLFLLETQREALERSALELAEVRRAAAVAKPDEPELEAPWLRARDEETEDEEEVALALRSPANATPAKHRDDAVDKWRKEWLSAMAHSM